MARTRAAARPVQIDRLAAANEHAQRRGGRTNEQKLEVFSLVIYRPSSSCVCCAVSVSARDDLVVSFAAICADNENWRIQSAAWRP